MTATLRGVATMRIGFIAGSSVDSGGERFLRELVEHAASAGAECISVGRIGGGFPSGVRNLALRVQGRKWSRRSRLRSLLPTPLFVAETLARVLVAHRRTRFALFHLQYKREQILLTLPLSLLAPVVWTEHGRLAEGRVFRTAYRWAARRTATIVGVSDFVSDSVRATTGDRGERVLTIRNGVDTDHFRPPSASDRSTAREELDRDPAVTAAVVGRIDAAKSLSWTVAFAAAHGLGLVVFGDGDDRERLEDLARSSGVDAHFAGRRPDVRPAFWSADFSLHGQDVGEGMPLALLEAAACGCIPVARRSDDLVASFVAEAGGLLVGDDGRFDGPLPDPAARVERAAAARVWAMSHDRAVTYDRYLQLFTELAS